MEPRYERRGERRSGRSRSRSPREHHRHRRERHSPDDDPRRKRASGHREERRRGSPRIARQETPKELPFEARRLGKGELELFRPLLSYYLRIQKQKDMAVMDEREVRGRWKSFLGKWNGGELAEGWYDPHIWEIALSEAKEARAEERRSVSRDEGGRTPNQNQTEASEARIQANSDSDSDSDDDEFGAPLPPPRVPGAKHTVSAPHLDDLRVRDELLQEEAAQNTADRVASIRHARRLDRRDQKEHLEELVPRADPGSRERQLEKRAEVNSKMREFREKSPGGEVDEGTLMGEGGGDSLMALKKEEEARAKKKSEREARREEIWKARMAEREERVREYREREEGTVAMLRELARNSRRDL